MTDLTKTPGTRSSAVLRRHGVASHAYSHGTYHVREAPERERLERFIKRLEFTELPEIRRIPTHNKRYRVYDQGLDGCETPLIIKISWANPAYRSGRLLNIRLSQLLKDYARDAFVGALELAQAGIPTIEPLACWRYFETPWKAESGLVYRKAPAAGTLRSFKDRAQTGNAEDARRFQALVQQWAELVRAMMDAGLRHDDIASGNFLVQEQPAPASADGEPQRRIVVIDTDHIRRSRVRLGPVRRFYDLRCLRRLDLPDEERRAFIRTVLHDDWDAGWWHVAEFWRRGGNRPLRSAVKQVRGGRTT